MVRRNVPFEAGVSIGVIQAGANENSILSDCAICDYSDRLLEQRISSLGVENTKVVGDAFEVFVEGYLATHQKLQADAVWLVGQVPLDIRQQLNLPKDAKGIDGVFRTRTGGIVPYQ